MPRPLLTGVCLLLLTPFAMMPATPQDAEPGEDEGPQTYREVEPNDEPAADGEGLPVLQLGDSFEAEISARDDRDHLMLDVPADTIVDFHVRWAGDARAAGVDLQVEIRSAEVRFYATQGDGLLRGYRLRAGRHLVRLRCTRFGDTPLGYRFGVAAVDRDMANEEIEPNDSYTEAMPIALPEGEARVIEGYVSTHGDTQDWFAITVPAEGVYQLDIIGWRDTADGTAEQRELEVQFLDPATGSREAIFHYVCDESRPEFRFFPVLAAQVYNVKVQTSRGGALVDDRYRLRFTPFEARVDAELIRSAREAIDRGLTWMIDNPAAQPSRATETAGYGAALMALGEGSGLADRSADRAARVLEMLEALEADIDPRDVEWHGEPVMHLGRASMYEVAIVTLALAECVAADMHADRARPLLEMGVRFLLASQVAPWRPEAWSPVEEGDPNIGGWRYRVDEQACDISVTGWALIALFAAEVAEVEVPGIERALRAGASVIPRHHRGPDGYAYQPDRGRGTTAVRQAIGALAAQLFNATSPSTRVAYEHVATNLAAATQSPDPHGAENVTYYFGYYGTRVQYLRGGEGWQRWRATMIRQLLRMQAEDGHWVAPHAESRAGALYSTGLAIVILRLCCNEPPAYLRLEAEAF